MHSIFKDYKLGPVTLKNRFVRAATYEGMADIEGVPTKELMDMYTALAKGDLGLLITGFCHISEESKAMQPAQAGIYTEEQVQTWSDITKEVKKYGTKICMQISHTGRQGIIKKGVSKLYSPSGTKCTYFRTKSERLTEEKIESIVNDYIQAAVNAKRAGFDGVQVHAAHGYLIHQFFSHHTNKRNDKYGGNYDNRFRFFKQIVEGIKKECGDDFLILTKLSSSDDRGLTPVDMKQFAKRMDALNIIHAIEISYGTMEFGVNIIRGPFKLDIVLDNNPLFTKYPKVLKWLLMKFYLPFYEKHLIKYTDNYNEKEGNYIKDGFKTPFILVGGIRTKEDMFRHIDENNYALVSLCRPFIREPDLIKNIQKEDSKRVRCVNCNLCTMYCDSPYSIRCFLDNKV